MKIYSLFPLVGKAITISESENKIAAFLPCDNNPFTVGEECNLGGIIFECVEVLDKTEHIVASLRNKYPLWENNSFPKKLTRALSDLLSLNAPFPLENVVAITLPTVEDVDSFYENRINFSTDRFWVIDVNSEDTFCFNACRSNYFLSRATNIDDIGVRPIIRVQGFRSAVGRTMIAFGFEWVCCKATDDYSWFLCSDVVGACNFYHIKNFKSLLEEWLISADKADFNFMKGTH